MRKKSLFLAVTDDDEIKQTAHRFRGISSAVIKGPLQRVLIQLKKHIFCIRFMAKFLKLPLEYQLQVWREGV
jgi:hypothetical protein